MRVATPTPTPADVDRLRVAFIRLARRIRTSSVETLTPSQLAVLGTVVRRGRLTVGQIAEIEHVKPPSVSKIVGALEVQGYLEREVDPNDRRCAYIVPSVLGTTYVEEVRAAGRTWLATRLDGLTEADRSSLAEALPVLERLLEVGE